MRLGDRQRRLRIADRVRLVEHLEQPVDGRAGLEGHREQPPDRLDRPPQNCRGREEREQLPDAQLAVRGQDHAAEQREREGDIRNQQQPEPQRRDSAGLLDLGAAQLVGLAEELLQRMRSAPERLEHPDAVHRLLDGGREVALLVLRAPRDDRVPLLEAVAEDPERDRAHQEQQTELPRPGEQDAEADREHDEVADQQHDAEREPAADLPEVAHGAREQLPALPAVVEGDRQVLQLGVEAVAHRGLDVGAGCQHEAAAQHDEQRLGDPESQHDARRRARAARCHRSRAARRRSTAARSGRAGRPSTGRGRRRGSRWCDRARAARTA